MDISLEIQFYDDVPIPTSYDELVAAGYTVQPDGGIYVTLYTGLVNDGKEVVVTVKPSADWCAYDLNLGEGGARGETLTYEFYVDLSVDTPIAIVYDGDAPPAQYIQYSIKPRTQDEGVLSFSTSPEYTVTTEMPITYNGDEVTTRNISFVTDPQPDKGDTCEVTVTPTSGASICDMNDVWHEIGEPVTMTLTADSHSEYNAQISVGVEGVWVFNAKIANDGQ